MAQVMERMHRSLIAGAAGAGALTLVHQMARTVTPYAPRMDVLGKRALRRVGIGASDEPLLERQALAGDLVANSAYYALVGAGSGNTWVKGLTLGLAAGLAAVFLPSRIGLGDPPSAERRDTQLMTIAWYAVGGLVAAAAFAASGGNELPELAT
jgi:hypothetical protein